MSYVPATERPPLIDVVLVEASACHLCEDAAAVLADAALRNPRVTVRRVALASEEGRAIARAHRVPMPPIVVIDGALLGWGRLSRGKLRDRLEALSIGGAG